MLAILHITHYIYNYDNFDQTIMRIEASQTEDVQHIYSIDSCQLDSSTSTCTTTTTTYYRTTTISDSDSDVARS